MFRAWFRALVDDRTLAFARRLFSHGAAASLGIAVGVSGVWAPLRPPLDELAPLAGHVASDHAGLPEPQFAAERVTPPLAPEPPPPAVRAPLAPREVAEHARSFTVFVQAGDFYGSGIVASERGHVLTCLHVVEDMEEVRVTMADGTHHLARVVDRDRKLDLALLQLPAPGAVVMKLGDAAAVRPGDDVYAMGAPRKMAFTLSRGMVSFANREVNGVSYLQLDLALNGGSSGGPILNELGEVVAMSSFILRESQGLSFALPIEKALARFAGQLSPAAPEGPSTTELRSASPG